MAVSSIQILLIEDDEEFRELLLGLLTDEGYQVSGVASGEQAIETAQGQRFDLVIADVKLGGMDGLDALSRIQDGQSELQSMVMTGYSTEADSIRAVKLGVSNYLKKPFTVADFLKAVESLAQRILEERELREREQALLETVAWALQTVLASCAELESPLEVATRSRDASLHCGLGRLAAENIRLAVLGVLVRRHGEPAGIPFVFRGLPPQVTTLLDSFEEKNSLEEQLVSYGVALAESTSADVPAMVIEAFGQSQVGQGGSEGLLPLGLALESSGDLDGAVQVFSRLVERSKRRREVIHGHLGRARVFFARGDSQASAKELELVSQEGTSLVGSEAQLERGVLLARMGRREPALEGLRLAREGFQRFGHALGSARSELALAALGESTDRAVEDHLGLLLQPQNLEAFFQSAPWLFPFLLRCSPESKAEQVQRGLKRYLRDLPTFTSNWLRHSRSPESVLEALVHLAEVGLSGYEAVLCHLAQSGTDPVRQRAQHLLGQGNQTPTAPVLRMFGMGEFEAFVGDRRVPAEAWRGKKSIYLLAFLAVKMGEFVPRELLVNHFWPDSGDRGYKNLSQLLVVIRRALQPPDWPENFHYLAREGSSIGLDPSLMCWHDVVEVESCLSKSESVSGETSAQELERVFELYRGPYLEGCYMDWAVDFRRELNRRLLDAGLTLSALRLSQERFQDALEVAEVVLRLDPLCQQGYLRLMEAQVGLGRPEDALRAFQRCEKKLRLELEIEPSTELLRAYHAAKLAL